MRAKYLLTTISVLSLGIAGNVLADDVYVNLSVLDNLQDTSAPVVRPKPLFPVISKSDSQKPAPVKKARKAKKASKKPVKEKLVIPAKQSVKVEVKETETKPEERLKQLKEVKLPEVKPVADTGPFKTAPAEAKTDSVQAAPSVPVKSETLPLEDKKVGMDAKAEGSTPLVSQNIEKVPSENIVPSTDAKEQSMTKLPTAPAETLNKNTETSSALQKELDDMEQKQASQQVQKTEEKPSLLIDNNPKPVAQEKIAAKASEIFFTPESDELTDTSKAEIDNIINAFENAKENKIAIYSFNLDNGSDTFRQKRISLNRAIAVRSYLLGKGYKNFSIKVVNLDAANGKENSVRIEELK